MNLRSLLVISIFITNFVWSLNPDETSNLQRNSKKYVKALNRLTVNVSSMLEVRLHELQQRLAGATGHSRSRRAILKNAPSPSELGLLRNIKPGQSLPAPSVIVDLAYVATSNRAYLIGAGRWNLDGSMRKVPCPVWQWNFQSRQFDLRNRVHVVSAVSVEAFVINDEPYFIFALNAREDLMDSAMRSSKLYKILPSGKIRIILSIPTVAATSWQSLIVGEQLFLIQASYLEWRNYPKDQKKNGVVPKGSSQIRIFQWLNGFVKVDSLNASYTTDVEVASIAGRYFIAVVNQTFKDYVESTLLIYEMKSRTVPGVAKVELFQKITGWAVSDIAFVTVGTELFLAVAYEFRVHNGQKVYEVASVIFRHNGLYFVKYQTVSTSCALRWTVIHGSEGEAMLHLQSTNQEQLLQFVDGSWVMLPLSILGVVGLVNKRMGVTSFVQGDVNNVAVAAPDRVQLLQLVFAVESQESIHRELLMMCRALRERQQQQQGNRVKMQENRQVVSLSRPQTILGHKRFKTVTIENLHLENVHLNQHQIFEHILTHRLDKLEGLLTTLDWAGFLTKSSEQEITGSFAVRDLSVENLLAPNVQFTDVNGVHLCSFLDRLVWFPPAHPAKVPIGTLHFSHLDFPRGFNLSGTLNGLKIPDALVFLDRPNHFSAAKQFSQGIEVKGNLVLGTVNGVRPEDFLLVEGDQVIVGDAVFHTDIDVASVDQLRDGRVSGVLWSWLLDEPLRLDIGGVVTGKKDFVGQVTIEGNLQPERLVAGVNVARMIEKAVPLRGQKVFQQDVQFRDVTFGQHLFVKGPFNGIHLPQDVVLLKRQPWPITLNFTTSTWAANLIVEGQVNGLKVDRNHIMTRMDYQIVTGRKTFLNMMAETDIILTGLLNGQNASQLIQNIPRLKVEVAEFYPDMSVRDLHVAAPLPEALHQLIYQSVKVNEPYAFPGQVTFMDVVTFEKDLIAPQTMFSGMLPVTSPEALNLAHTTFHDVIFEEDIVIEGELNGFNAARLFGDIMLTVGDQTVTAPKEFLTPMQLHGNTNFRGPINGVNLAEALRLDGKGHLPPRMEYFTTPVVLGESNFQAVEVNTAFNGRPVVVLLEDTLLREGDQKIAAPKHFVHGVGIGVTMEGIPTKNVDVRGSILLDGVNLVELMQDVVLLNESNVISGPTTFAADVKLKDFVAPVVDDVDVRRLFAMALKRDEERCPTFQSSISVDRLQSAIINLVNIDEFLNNVVFVTDDVLPGQLHFAEISSPTVHLTGLVNGVKFSKDIVRKNGLEATTITAPKTFAVALSMNQVQVHGLVNGVDIERLDQTAVKQGTTQVIHGDLVVTELNARRDIAVKGLVAGKNLRAFLHDAMYVDENARIKGFKEFDNLAYNPDPPHQLIIVGYLDNVNLTHVANYMVTLDTPQTISGPLTFAKNLDTQNLEVANIRLGEDSLVNNKKLPAWVQSVMKTEGPQVVHGKKTFMNPVTMANNLVAQGTINQVLTEDLLRLSGDQKVVGPKSFEAVEVNTLEVRGLLMDVNVNQWAQHAVMTDRPEPAVIRGRKEFGTLVLGADARFDATVDGVDLNKVMTTGGDQVITGDKEFAGGLTVPRWSDVAVRGQLNGSPQPLPLIMERLLSSPLPYPCKVDFLYHDGWCYKVHAYTEPLPVKPEEECARLQVQLLMTLNENQRDLFRRMGLHETPTGWFIEGTTSNTFTCVYKATITVHKPMKMTGNFLFDGNLTIHGPQEKHLRSPVEDEFKGLKNGIEQLGTVITAEAASINSRVKDMCNALDNINGVFKNAYRPMGEFRILHSFSTEIKKIYKLEHAVLVRASFLSLESQRMALHFWQNNMFVEVASVLLTSEVGELLDIEHESFQDQSGVVTLLLPTSTKLCPRSEVGNIEVLQVDVTLFEERKAFDVGRVFNLGFHCTRPSNIDIMIVGNRKLLLLGLKHTLEVWNWNTTEQTFTMAWKQNEPQYIRFVKAVGSNGHALVVSGKDDGTSVLTMYSIRDDGYGLVVETSIHQSGVITHLSTVASSNNLHIVTLDESQLKLLEYHPESKWFNLKQALENYPSATRLHWIPMPQFAWLFVASCGHTDSYQFTGYLANHQPLEVTMTDKPHLFIMQHAIYMVVKLKINGEDKYVNLESLTRGPTNFQECRIPC